MSGRFTWEPDGRGYVYKINDDVFAKLNRAEGQWVARVVVFDDKRWCQTRLADSLVEYREFVEGEFWRAVDLYLGRAKVLASIVGVRS